MKKLIVLGSTGSIGSQTLDVVRQHPERFSVVALAAKKSWQRLVKQAREFKVQAIALLDDEAALEDFAATAQRYASAQLPAEVARALLEAGAGPGADVLVSAAQCARRLCEIFRGYFYCERKK